MTDGPSGLDLMRKVLDQVESHPELHYQNSWAVQFENSSCGTACCLAGWAAVLHYGSKPNDVFEWEEVTEERTDKEDRFASYHPNYRFTHIASFIANGHHVQDVARDLLGISNNEAEYVFAGFIGEDEAKNRLREHTFLNKCIFLLWSGPYNPRSHSLRTCRKVRSSV